MFTSYLPGAWGCIFLTRTNFWQISWMTAECAYITKLKETKTPKKSTLISNAAYWLHL
jgi:uncharacterized cysteine cluster protein YcgN (CxxCxxCC family)